jgi:hypothetical protein
VEAIDRAGHDRLDVPEEELGVDVVGPDRDDALTEVDAFSASTIVLRISPLNS